MVELQDELAFAQALAQGEPAAVITFERRYRPIVRHALRRALSRWRPEAPVEPEDSVQDFVGFLLSDGGRRLRSFEGRAAFGSWLYTVALRHFQRAFARTRADRRSDAALSTLPDLDGADPEGALAQAQQAARLTEAVHQLPAQDQVLVRLFFVEGLNATEVARTVGQGTSAVRMRKLRLLERLRALLGEPVPNRSPTPPTETGGLMTPAPGGSRS